MRHALASVLLLCGLLAGCQAASRLHGDVEAFSARPFGTADRTVAIVPRAEGAGETLEWRNHARVLAGKLTAAGMRVVPDSETADLVAIFGFGIDNGRTITTVYPRSRWGLSAYTGFGSYRRIGDDAFLFNRVTVPLHGPAGYREDVRSRTEYMRSVSVRLVEADSQEPVFETTVRSAGACGRLSPLMPALLDAAFSAYPKGGDGRVDLPLGDEFQC